MKYQVKSQIKEIHKQLVKAIRKAKSEDYQYIPESWEFRHRHIAYCLMRGRTIKQIEPKVHQGNERSEELVQKFIDQYKDLETEAQDEVVHHCG